MNEPLQRTLIDAALLLDQQGIPYALIGGLAVSLRGRTRATVDVDLVIAADVDQAMALLEDLDGTEFQPLFSGVAEVVQRSFIVPLRHRITNVKLDLALGLSGFEQQAVKRAEQVPVAGHPIAVATVEDLLVMKALAGRPQDDQDVRGLIAARGDQIDWNNCLAVATQLGEALGLDVAGRLRSLRSGLQP